MARYRIGRSRENDIVLTDTTVSRQHSEIEDLGGGRFVLRDVGSSRGTHVEQAGAWQDVTETEVTADQPIMLGELKTSITALLKEAGIAAPAPSKADAAAASGPSSDGGQAGASGGRAASGGGLSPGAKWALIGGGIFLVVAIVTAVVLVLVLGDGKGGNFGNAGGTGGTPKIGAGGGTDGGAGGGNDSANARFIRACAKGGSANQTQCRCMAGVARRQLSKSEFKLFTLTLEASRDSSKRAELQSRAQELAALTKQLRTLARAVQKQCGGR